MSIIYRLIHSHKGKTTYVKATKPYKLRIIKNGHGHKTCHKIGGFDGWERILVISRSQFCTFEKQGLENGAVG